MALTKTQINYLLDKLARVVQSKEQQLKKELGVDKSLGEIIIERLASGEIPLPSREKIIETLTSKVDSYPFFSPTITLPELIYKDDYDEIAKEVQEKNTIVKNYSDKLYKAKQDALDKIVLEGIDIETAIAELNKIEV